MAYILAIEAGRATIAKRAEADGEHIFARQVRAGCWDHREDVAKAIADAETLRASLIHGLRSAGIGRIEAENEADERLAKMALKSGE